MIMKKTLINIIYLLTAASNVYTYLFIRIYFIIIIIASLNHPLLGIGLLSLLSASSDLDLGIYCEKILCFLGSS